METIQQHKREISESFKKAASIRDLVELLNKIQNWEADNPFWKHKHKEITVKGIKYFLYNKEEKYSTFDIAKKSGGTRTINSPHKYLKKVQRLLNYCFQSVFTPMPQATGFVPGRSVVTNAQMHTGKKYVYNIDIKDFFPSISFFRVWAVLSKVNPFRLDNEVARIVANLCCNDGVLPQGAPTSPVISNIICMRLDRKMYFLSKELGFTYSRYADDITISSNQDIFSNEFKENISSIIKEEGFELNMKKERLQKFDVEESGKKIRQRQEVTGIIVNKKTNVSRRYIRDLRAALFNWEKHGYERASQQYRYFYRREKGFTRYKRREKGSKDYIITIPPFENFIGGKLEYLGMVRGKEDPTYIKMKLQFDTLCLRQETSLEELNKVLDIWDTYGMKRAMDYFYNRRNVVTPENGSA